MRCGQHYRHRSVEELGDGRYHASIPPHRARRRSNALTWIRRTDAGMVLHPWGCSDFALSRFTFRCGELPLGRPVSLNSLGEVSTVFVDHCYGWWVPDGDWAR